MRLKNKHKITFASGPIKVLVDEQKDKYLAKASLENLRELLPEIDERNVDLLPFSCSAYVANVVNLNGAGVATAEALESVDLFKKKFVNFSHKRNQIVGVITDVAFTEFGTEKLIKKETLKDTKKAFNINVSGFIWKLANEELAEFIEDTNNPLSENYLKLSASFEMSFNDYDIAILPKGEKYLENAEYASEDKIPELSSKLKVFGGDGVLDEEKDLAVVLKGDVLALGIGLTSSPAAKVTGIAVPKDDDEDEEDEDIEEDSAQIKKNNENLTNEEKISVIANTEQENIKEKQILNKNMPKLNSYKEITDEILKANQVTASSIQELVESELKVATDKWAQERKEKESQIQENQTKAEQISKENEQLKKDFQELKANFEKLQNEQIARENQEKFNTRMAYFDDKYELTKEDRQVIASQIEGLNDEQFEKYEKNISILLANKNKETIAKIKEDAEKSKENKETKETKAGVETVIDDAIDNAKKTSATPPATSSTNPKTLKEKLLALEAAEHADVQIGRKKR